MVLNNLVVGNILRCIGILRNCLASFISMCQLKFGENDVPLYAASKQCWFLISMLFAIISFHVHSILSCNFDYQYKNKVIKLLQYSLDWSYNFFFKLPILFAFASELAIITNTMASKASNLTLVVLAILHLRSQMSARISHWVKRTHCKWAINCLI